MNAQNGHQNRTDHRPRKVEFSGNTELEEDSKQKEHVPISRRFKNLFLFFTVEPFLLCYIFPNIISSIALSRLNIEKACRSDLNYTEDVCNKVNLGDVTDNITTEALTDASIMVAEMTAWRQPLQSGIPAILILFVGAWSDRTGNRKALMLIPLLGEIVSSVGMLLATYFFLEWPLWVTGLIEGLPPAVFGGLSIALMGSYSYLADVTTVESRTFRMGLVAVIVTLGIPLGSAVSGILLDAVGYYGIFGICLVFYIIGFVHTFFRIHDVRHTETEGTLLERVIQFFHLRNIWDTISLIVMSRGRQLARVLLVIWAHIVIVGPVFGEGPILYLYTLKKFNMEYIEFSLFTTYTTLMGLAGTAIAVTVFSKYLNLHDAILGMIATTCKVVSSVVYALAPNKTWLYAAPAFDFFGNSGVTAIRSLGTKIVEPDQVGKICSLIGFAEAVVPVIYTPIYSKLYANTLETFPGAFYLLGGAMTVPAFFIFIILYVLHKKEERDRVKDPDAKEMYAHENAITSL